MNVSGIKTKIGNILEKLKGSITAAKGGFLASLTSAVSLFKGIKDKNKPIMQGKSPQDSGSAAKESHDESPSALGGVFAAKIDYISDRYLTAFPKEKRKPVLFALGGLLVLFMILLISALALHDWDSKDGMSDKMAGIPNEELFYPSEPDFVPGFLLEREPKYFWTVEDIQPYWRIPAHSEFWHREIKSAVDKLMDGVP